MSTEDRNDENTSEADAALEKEALAASSEPGVAQSTGAVEGATDGAIEAEGAEGGELVSASLGSERWVTFAFFAGASILFWLAKNLIVTVWDRFDEPKPAVATAVAAAIAVGAAIAGYRHPGAHGFATEVAEEYARVTWPSREEGISHTAVVLVVSLVATIILACFDFGWGALSDLLYQV